MNKNKIKTFDEFYARTGSVILNTTKSVQSVKKVHIIRLEEESRKDPSNSSGTMELSSYRDQHFKVGSRRFFSMLF